MSRYQLSHTTSYEYESPVVHAHHLAYLRPRESTIQQISDWQLEVTPEPLTVTSIGDYFGNQCHEIELLSPHETLCVTSSCLVELTTPERDADALPKTSWEAAASRLREDRALLAFAEFCFDSPLVRAHARFGNYAATCFTPRRPLAEAALALNQLIYDEFTYDAAVTDISTPLMRVLQERRGVCQDFAHLMIGCLRSLGLAARYVSGYLETLPPPGRPRLVGADASHAWASIYVPDHGWLDLDPTNGVAPRDRHITLAHGRDFSDVSPLRGVVLGGGSHRLKVSVDVAPLS